MIIAAKGMLIGLSIAAPVGPIGLLCMKRALNQGRRYGLASGLGAATADGLYGLAAAFGFDAATAWLLAAQDAVSAAGGLFLCYLGWRTFRSGADGAGAAGRSGSLAGAYWTTFALTIANPATILSFLGIFAGLNVVDASAFRLLTLVGGIFAGSACWWLGLSLTVGALRRTLKPAAMRQINRLSGLLLAGFGLYALSRLL
ncbi:LysE family transporter [Paenibacillus sp. MWE-103]|uniref:LysE family transporter n=1 Tax=Paenibacillus artemisiicola TaxID=1172618 RepID=A0ABS3WB77_9BACL|nr:LysE family transporter [Paenibacillus artemisiicola]MBO7745565.1 LysE family transporter [Paenibacillus artemisiicola]